MMIACASGPGVNKIGSACIRQKQSITSLEHNETLVRRWLDEDNESGTAVSYIERQLVSTAFLSRFFESRY
jgi:hypothetical protein